MTTEEFYEFMKAIRYSELALQQLKIQIDESGRSLIWSILIIRIVLHSLAFVKKF